LSPNAFVSAEMLQGDLFEVQFASI
jgi:hypothetical protein